jgi:benzoylformate decarboxylase
MRKCHLFSDLCFINREYSVLKTDFFQNKSSRDKQFLSLDLNHPPIDVQQIALSFGAQLKEIQSIEDIEPVLNSCFSFQGPTFIALYHQ